MYVAPLQLWVETLQVRVETLQLRLAGGDFVGARGVFSVVLQLCVG